jgi:hypothetical protein
MPAAGSKEVTLKSVLSILIWLGAIALTSCSALQPQVLPGGVLFQDDFSRPVSGWDRFRDEIYEADYASSTYRIRVITPQTLVWSLPGVNLEDVRLAVEARAIEGTSDNLFGIICRYVNADNYIFFLVSSDGYAGIGRYVGGTRDLLTDESLLPTDAIHAGEDTNLLTATCQGDSLTLEVNGRLVAQAEVEGSEAGDIGLLSGTYDVGGTVIEFDNFSATKP